MALGPPGKGVGRARGLDSQEGGGQPARHFPTTAPSFNLIMVFTNLPWPASLEELSSSSQHPGRPRKVFLSPKMTMPGHPMLSHSIGHPQPFPLPTVSCSGVSPEDCYPHHTLSLCLSCSGHHYCSFSQEEDRGGESGGVAKPTG